VESIAGVHLEGDGPADPAAEHSLVRGVGNHAGRKCLAYCSELEKTPSQRVCIASVQDGLEVKVAACGRSGGPNPCNDLANLHLVTGLNADGLKVVVGGDEAVPVINLHPVATTPRVPAGCPHNTGVSCIDGRAAGGCVVLAEVKIPCRPADRTHP
jgi:hypothetical protein